MEHPQTLMHPQPQHRHLRVTVELIEYVDTLDDLADVSHVEDVVGFGGGRQEVLAHRLVEVYCGEGQGLRQGLYLVLELLQLELVRQDRLEDAAHLRLRREREVDDVELGEDATGDLGTASSWWAHR